jgi:TetR/AcrR family transcriptional regulator, mexJK operon transcriptional repressor
MQVESSEQNLMHGSTSDQTGSEGTPRRGAGRPTREQAEARLEELLDSALDHFLRHGFELATIDMIAAHVNMTKRTVYAKFEDKAGLFLAAVQRAIERQIVPKSILEGFDKGDLADTLRAIGRLRIEQVMTPNGMRLQHIIQSESYRFPQIFEANFQQSARPVMKFVADLLRRALSEGKIAPTEPDMAASAFMSMVVGGQVRSLVGGQTLTAAEIDARLNFSVDLLLNGLRPR